MYMPTCYFAYVFSKHLYADRKKISWVVEFLEGSAVDDALKGQRQFLSFKVLSEFYHVEVARLVKSRDEEVEPAPKRRVPMVDGCDGVPELIVGDRVVDGRKEYLVRWKGKGSSDDEWVSESAMHRCSRLVQVYEGKGKKG